MLDSWLNSRKIVSRAPICLCNTLTFPQTNYINDDHFFHNWHRCAQMNNADCERAFSVVRKMHTESSAPGLDSITYTFYTKGPHSKKSLLTLFSSSKLFGHIGLYGDKKHRIWAHSREGLGLFPSRHFGMLCYKVFGIYSRSEMSFTRIAQW